MRSPRSAVAVLVAASVLAAGCTQDRPAVSLATTTAAPATSSTGSGDLTGTAVGEEGYTEVADPAWEPSTAAEEIAAREDADGLDAQIAVDLFDLAFGDMPGASDRSTDDPGEVSTTRALGLVEQFADELTPEQRGRVAEVVGRFPGAVDVTDADAAAPLPPEWEAALADTAAGSTGPTTAAPTTAAAPTTTAAVSKVHGLRAVPREPIPELKAVLNGLVARIAQGWRNRLGNVGLPSLRIAYSSTAFTTAQGLDAYATSQPDQSTCIVTMFPSLYQHVTELGPNYVMFVLAHELFHCVEFEWAPGIWQSAPQWVIEGGADFAGLDFFRKKVPVDGQFEAWFGERTAPLAARAYSGAGLWEAAAAEGIDPFAALKAGVRASGTTEQVLAAVGLNSPRFLLAWPTRTVRTQAYQHPSWTMPWAGSGDGMHENFVKGPTIGLGGTNLVGPANFSHSLRAHVFGSGVDVVTVRNKGKHLASLANDRENIVLGSNEVVRLCVEESRCTCPDGNYGNLRFFDSTDVAVGFSASREPGLVTVLAEKFDPKKHCDRPRPKGSSDGDPHLLTMDGVAFELMSAGEFVLASAPGDGSTPAFDVQMRTAPAARPGDRYSLITAVAVRYGDDRVTLTVPDYLSRPDEVVVRRNGEPADVDGATLGALTLARDDERNWRLSAPDGTEVSFRYLNGFFVEVTPPEATAGRLVGMLGAANGDPLDDVRLADGTDVNANDWDVVHHAFADSWRVADATSLFDYRAGESTATFTDRAFPGAFPELETAAFQEARQRCHESMGRAATTPEIDACAFDSVATGDDAYADVYAEVVDDRSPTPDETAPLPDRPTTTRSGGAAAAPGEASLHLRGKLAPISDPSPPADAVAVLSGKVRVPAGSLITVVMECPAGAFYGVDVSDPSQEMATLTVCQDTTPLLDDNDRAHSGEASILVGAAGSYELALTDLAPSGTTRSVDVAVYVDPEPASGERASGPWVGQVTGIGDVATLRVPEGPARFSVVATGDVCIAVVAATGRVADGILPPCDTPDATLDVVGGAASGSLVVVYARDRAGGRVELTAS